MSDRLALSLRNRLDDLALVQDAAERFLAEHKIGAEPAYLLRLVIEELVSNVIRYGYADQRQHAIQLTIDIHRDSIDLQIDDDGRPFDPTRDGPDPGGVPDPSSPGGRGLALVAQIAGPICYTRVGGGNRVQLRIPLRGSQRG